MRGLCDERYACDAWALAVGRQGGAGAHVRRTHARERERWHAVWLLARGWSAAQVAEALERDAHTIGDWAEDFRQKGPAGLAFEQSGGSPPPSTRRNKRN